MSTPARHVVADYFLRLASMLFPMRHWLPHLSPATVRADFWAGLTGAVMVLPQGIAFALIAGLPPEFGLYSAIVVQLLAGLFGSSWHMVSGPTVALSIVIPGIIAPYAVPGSPQYIGLSLTVMMMVGIIQLSFGLFRLGSLVNFISHTVIIGFTAGAGFLIIMSQLPAFFGHSGERGLALFERLESIFAMAKNPHWPSLAIALVTLAIAIGVRRIRPRAPHMLLGMVGGTLFGIAIGASGKGVAMLGALPSALPQFTLPDLPFQTLTNLLPSAFALALLGLIEAVSIARSIAIRSHQRIDGNQEFFGQGLSNIVGSCCSCYVGSGSFNRSAINYDSGAKTPIALVFTSAIIAIVLLFFPWLTRELPLPAMAATILLAGYNLFDFKHIRIIARTSRNELSIILVTFISTLFINLEFAIYAGVILSLVLYLQKTSHPLVTEVDFSELINMPDAAPVPIHVIRLDGSLFFGAVDHVQNRLAAIARGRQWQHLVILAEGVNIIDVAGIEMLLSQKMRLQKTGGDLYLIGVKPHLRRKLAKSPYWQRLDGDNTLFDSTYVAFRTILRSLNISNYRAYMKHLFRDYQKL
ncbi:MAG: SulP family inorganic anion transporter [Cardiobacteriaceae bacterium]|nr:SulP family inorganic anion transporter [Cardiobacteriaceae bacterium]